jgi:transcription antitermination factor NusG
MNGCDLVPDTLATVPLRSSLLDPFAADREGKWVVLHVKSRQEKALSQDLSAIGVGHFLPLVPRERRGALTDAPLFPGYLFLRGSVDDAFRADRTRRVANIITVKDQTQLHEELWNLHLALARGVAPDEYKWIRRGLRVEVVRGPLQGLRGLVEDRQSMNRVILQVQMLGTAVSIAVDSDCVAAID